MSEKPSAKMPAQILIIDNDSTVGQAIEASLSSYNVTVQSAQELETALYQFNNQDFEVVFIENTFESIPGLAMVQKLRESDLAAKRATAFVIMSGSALKATQDALVKELMDIEVINKPFTLVQILPFLSRGYATYQRLSKYEAFKDKILSVVEQGHVGPAIKEIQGAMSFLGARGVQLISHILENIGRYDDALAFVQPIWEQNRGVPLFDNLYGHLLFKAGRLKEAKGLLEEADKIAPLNLKRLNDLANLYLMLKDSKAAVAKITQLFKLYPDRIDRQFSYIEALYDNGFEQEAIDLCKKNIKPMEVIRYYNNRGVQCSKKGDHEGAIREYEKALKFFPNFRENYCIYYNIALAQVKFKTKQSYAAAIKNLEHCLKLKPDFEKAKNTLNCLNAALERSNSQNKAS